MPEIPAAVDLDGFPIQAMTTMRLDEIRVSYPFTHGGRHWSDGDAEAAFDNVEDLVVEVDRLLVVEAAFAETLKPEVPHEPCHPPIWTCAHGRTAVPLSTLADVVAQKQQAMAERAAALMEVERLRERIEELKGKNA